MAAGSELTGFFAFDTNLNAIVSDIEGGLRRLNSTLSTPLKGADLLFNTQELQTGFQRAEQTLVQGQARLRELFSQRGAGLIDRGTFEREVRSTLTGTVGRIPQMLTEELSRVPASVASTAPVKAIATTMASDFTKTLEQELDAGLAGAGNKLRSVERFKNLLGDLQNRIAASPLVANGTVSPLAEYTTRLRAEQLVAADPAVGPKTAALAEQLGLSKVVSQVANQVKPDGNGGLYLPATDTAQRLRELMAVEREEESVARQAQKTRETSDEALRQEALAVRADAEAWEQLANAKRRDASTGVIYKPTASGLVEEPNQRLAQEQYAAKVQAQADKDHTASLKEQLELEKQKARDTLNNSGFFGGVQNRLQKNDSSLLTNIGSQIAQAGSFTLAYGALFGLQHALRDTMHEFLDYQDSITDLEVATRGADVVTGDWVNSLAELARTSGSNVGAALDSAARGVRAFTDQNSTKQDIKDAGTLTAKASTELALIAGKSLPDATGNIVAAGSAFGLAPDQLQEVVDAVANAKRSVGGDASQIAQGLSLIALSAQEAGFNLNEAASVIALVQARTDESGQAIATRLTRVFQILQGSTGQSLARELAGQDKSGTLTDDKSTVKQRLTAFAKIYANPETDETTRNRIASALGGTANLRELLPLLKEGSTLQYAYAQAIQNAGQGTDEFNRKTNNLVGTLLKIKADISFFQVGLSKSGLFDFVGAGIKTIEPALYAVAQLVNEYDALTENVPALRELVGLTVDLVLAAKLLGALKLAGFTVGAARAAKAAKVASGAVAVEGAAAGGAIAAGGAAGAAATDVAVTAENAARQREIAVITAMAEQRLIAEGRINEVIQLAGVRRGVVETEAAAVVQAGAVEEGAARTGGALAVGAGSLLGFLTNPAAILGGAVLGALALYGVARQQSHQIDAVQDTARDSLKSFDRIDGSAASYQKAALDQNTAAGTIRKSDVPSDYKDSALELASAATQRRDTLLYLARRAAAEESYATKLQSTTLFGTGAIETTQQLADGLEKIALNGGTALDQFNAVVKALRTPPPDPGKQYFTRQGLNNSIITTLLGTARDSIPDGVTATTPSRPKPTLYTRYNNLNPQIPTVDQKDLVLAQIGLAGNGTKGLSPEGLGILSLTGLDPKALGISGVKASTAKAINKALNQAQKELGLHPEQGLTDGQVETLVNVAMKEIDLSSLGKDGQKVAEAWYKNTVAALKSGKVGKVDKTGTPLDLLNGNGPLSSANITSLLQPNNDVPEGQAPYAGLIAIFQNALGSIPESDDGSKLEQLKRTQAAVWKSLIERGKKTGADVSTLELLFQNAVFEYRQTAIQNADDLRQAAESRATTNKQLRAVRLRFAKTEFKKAGNQVNLIEQVMEELDRKTVNTVIEYQREAVQIAKLAYEHAQALVQTAMQILRTNPFAGTAGIAGAIAQAKGAKDNLTSEQKHLQALLDGLKQSTITDPVAKLADKANKAASDALENRVAGLYLGSNFNNPVQQARLDVAAARMRYNADKNNQNLLAVQQAIANLQSTMLQQQIAGLSLHGDITDPVEQARDALRAARMQYRLDHTNTSLVNVRTSEAALEKARWDQKLSDMQTAEQLGRISYATYIRFLQNESDRMHKIQHKTRQQIDMMNQVDLELQQATASMEGQFNLGDINTNGFVYAVRRMATATAAAASGGTYNPFEGHGTRPTVTGTINNRIEFSGVSEAQLRRVLKEIMSGVPIHTTTPRKVA